MVGTGALAGCFGDSGGASETAPGSDGEMIMKTASETTAAYSMSQVISSAVSQNSDVKVDARPSQGTNRNVSEVVQGKTEIAYVQNWTANKIRQGEKPFGDLAYQPNQVFHLYDLAWFLATANDGWTSVTDITADSNVSPTPRGAGTAEMLEYALDFAVDDYNRTSVSYGDQAGAMSEGRLDVGAATYVNLSIEPGWLQQMKSTVDLRVLNWPEEIVSELEDDPAIVVSDIDMSQFDDYGYTPETLSTPTLAYNFIVREDHDYDTLKSFLETLWEQRKGLQEQTGLLAPMANGDSWVKHAYTGIPFHPAAADFYEEKGLWSDEFERGTAQ
ncbi:TAXI family TRAP transporter solute-binding subunit [Halorientalis brevis]|uniref:TAXI family TRAP transporter solute-binding subunit n=1 Tax=Halorientalis brevis TaxID=1126241 RepID=A0ABD6CD92_9EURY|nr:TAXI family TRAP transporter solute-binding subunit [Halorientalis brevis]